MASTHCEKIYFSKHWLYQHVWQWYFGTLPVSPYFLLSMYNVAVLHEWVLMTGWSCSKDKAEYKIDDSCTYTKVKDCVELYLCHSVYLNGMIHEHWDSFCVWY